MVTELGAPIEACTRGGSTALHYAVRGSKIAAVRTLAALGADLRREERFCGHTALHIAVHNCCCEIVSMVVNEFGASLDVRDPNGRTPLHVAVQTCYRPKMIRLLVSLGADVEAKDGLTPFSSEIAIHKRLLVNASILLGRLALMLRQPTRTERPHSTWLLE